MSRADDKRDPLRDTEAVTALYIIWSPVRKPGGFARYVYREEMFGNPLANGVAMAA